MKKALLLMALFAGSLLSANAQTADYLTAYVKPGAQKQLAIQLKNNDNYTAFQMTIKLPTTMSFTADDPVLSDRADATTCHNLYFNKVDDQTMKVAVFSADNIEGTPTTGNLAFKNAEKNVLLLVNVNATGAFDASQITVSDIEFVKLSSNVEENLTGKELAVTAKGLLGDVKKDGELSTLDATYVLRKYAGQTLNDYDSEAEDMNLDGELSTLDATAILKEYARQ